METGRNVMHYALGDNQDYEHEWSKAVLEYLENGYSSEDSKSEVEVGNPYTADIYFAISDNYKREAEYERKRAEDEW